MCDECNLIEFIDPILLCKMQHRQHKITGQFHCKTNPAILYPSYKEYRLYGSMHRIDGPAFESKDENQWFINGKIILNSGGKMILSQEDFENSVQYKTWKLKAFK